MDYFSSENTYLSTSKQVWGAFEINLSGVKHIFVFNLTSLTLTRVIYTLDILLWAALFTFVFI
jgi:hypothetical protein